MKEKNRDKSIELPSGIRYNPLFTSCPECGCDLSKLPNTSVNQTNTGRREPHASEDLTMGSKDTDFGNKPFIYAANLTLSELEEWLREEFFNIQRRRQALVLMSYAAKGMLDNCAGLLNHHFLENVRLCQESSLPEEAMELSHKLLAVSELIKQHELLPINCPGEGRPEEQIKAVPNSTIQYGQDAI